MTDLPKMHSFFDELLLLSLEIPEDWQVTQTEQFALLLLAPPKNNYSANLGINRGLLDPPTQEGLAQLITESQVEQQRSYNSYRLTDSQWWTLNNAPAYTRRYEWVDPGSQLHFSQLQTFIYVAPHLYLIDGSSLKQHEEQYISVLDAIIASIRFIPPPPTQA